MSRSQRRTALVVSYSKIESDPRVRRQIDWLYSDGWTVDTLGLGEHPSSIVRSHFLIGEAPSWTRSKTQIALRHVFTPARKRFHGLMLDRVPAALMTAIHQGDYDFVLLNELELAPWVGEKRARAIASSTKVHLDLHEFHDPHRRRNTFGAKLTAHHHRWVRRHIGHARFDSRTVVNEPIGNLYLNEFDIPRMAEVRNVPRLVQQLPSPVDPQNIRMLFHGLGSFQRGFAEILEAMRSLPSTFSMTFMLMPNPALEAWLTEQISNHPAKDRIEIVPPAPMREIATRINEYDLEIIFYRPTSKNLEFAQPNKFFESIQGRLGIVVGETVTMAPIVREWGNGVVAKGFDGADLAAALRDLTPAAVEAMKAATNAAALVLNAEEEGKRFLSSIQ